MVMGKSIQSTSHILSLSLSILSFCPNLFTKVLSHNKNGKHHSLTHFSFLTHIATLSYSSTKNQNRK